MIFVLCHIERARRSRNGVLYTFDPLRREDLIMGKRQKQDHRLSLKRTKDDLKVLRHLMKKSTLAANATGGLESPQKLVVFYAGYIAMRRLWERHTNNGRIKTGDPDLDVSKNDTDSFIYRIDKEIAHALGLQTNTLLKVAKFRFWGKKILAVCDKMSVVT